ncbi:MAG TPA: SatD family protein [Chitinophagaceae bacterium]|nr:SatD family protein [Chitinophagaceae bacterium]
MISVITGDVIGSQKTNPKLWLKPLKKELDAIGESPKFWEIYRGDSFQAVIAKPEEALRVAIKIKASLKSIPDVDVRMAIGIGTRTHNAQKVTESNGTAFVHSGEKFEMLKRERQNLAVKSDWPGFDKEMNLLLKLSLIVMDNWTVNAAEVVKTTMENPGKVQEELGQIVGIRQNAISNRLKRAYYDEMMEVNEMYAYKLKSLK